MNLISARMGVSVTVHGQTRLAHALSHELFDALQIGIRTGAIGGLLATSLGLGGMSIMWLTTTDTLSLSGFGSGASIVSFYMRVGGGIFSKGADIGADLVGEAEGEEEQTREEENRVFQMQQKQIAMEADRKIKEKQGITGDDADIMAAIRGMEQEMSDIATQLLPIDYLDAVGENINDVAGQCADLFESMVLILCTCAIIGSKGGPAPYFNSGLPFWIVGTGKMGSSLVSYYCHCHESFTSQRIRWTLRTNLVTIIVLVQIVQIGVSFQEYMAGVIEFD